MNGARDIYLILGWKTGPEHLKGIMSDMSEKILEKGLRVVFMADGTKGAFVGKVLAYINQAEGPLEGSAPLPTSKDIADLREGMDLLGLSGLAQTEPALWALLG